MTAHHRRWERPDRAGPKARSPKPMVMHTCTKTGCTKQTYASKTDARRAARQLYLSDRLSAYRCGEGWHIGHLPAGVTRGIYTRPRHTA